MDERLLSEQVLDLLDAMAPGYDLLDRRDRVNFIAERVKALESALAAAERRAGAWVTVTEDPATWPPDERGRVVAVVWKNGTAGTIAFADEAHDYCHRHPADWIGAQWSLTPSADRGGACKPLWSLTFNGRIVHPLANVLTYREVLLLGGLDAECDEYTIVWRGDARRGVGGGTLTPHQSINIEHVTVINAVRTGGA